VTVKRVDHTLRARDDARAGIIYGPRSRGASTRIWEGRITMPDLMGFSHVELTVTDCEKSAAWYQDVLGFQRMTHGKEKTFEVFAMRHPSGAVVDVLTHHETPQERFDERRVGLDHLSMQVADRGELERWIEHLDRYSVAHTGIIDAIWGPTVVFRDPDNIQLELMVHPTPEQLAKLLEEHA
jgi:glyoxylase I family protein